MNSKALSPKVRGYLSRIGAVGGRKSRRALNPSTARKMIAIREARRAFRDYYIQCFWSYRKDARIGMEDLAWIVRGLKTEGDRRAYDWARRIERHAKA